MEYMLVLRLPETMEVAVCVNSLYLVTLANCKANLRFLTWLQKLALIALLGLEGHPLNVVFRNHRMFHCTDGHGDLVALNLIDRNMLFLRSIRSAGDDLCHLLAATHNRDARVFDLCDDVSAMLTNIEFLIHNDTSMLTRVVFSVFDVISFPSKPDVYYGLIIVVY